MRNALLGIGLLAGAALMAGAQPANAAVYCKYVGVPKGCVVRRGVVLRPAPVVYCKYVGVPKGCVVRRGVVLGPAPVVRRGVVVRPVPRRALRRGINRGGPVNRIGVR